MLNTKILCISNLYSSHTNGINKQPAESHHRPLCNPLPNLALRRCHGELEGAEARAAHACTPLDLFKPPSPPSPTAQDAASRSSPWTRPASAVGAGNPEAAGGPRRGCGRRQLRTRAGPAPWHQRPRLGLLSMSIKAYLPDAVVKPVA